MSYKRKKKLTTGKQMRSKRVTIRRKENKLRATRLTISSSDVALGRLRNATSQSLQSADYSLNACLERTETTGKLLDQCAEAYRDMAANADRHANDVDTLKQAWPTALPETGIHWFTVR